MTEKESLINTMKEIRELIQTKACGSVRFKEYYYHDGEYTGCYEHFYLFFVNETRLLLGFIPIIKRRVLCKLDLCGSKVLILDGRLISLREKIIKALNKHRDAWIGIRDD